MGRYRNQHPFVWKPLLMTTTCERQDNKKAGDTLSFLVGICYNPFSKSEWDKVSKDMKQVIAMILLFLTAFVCLVRCWAQEAQREPQNQTAAIGNPWSDWDSLEEAETAVGFYLDLPEVISDRYTAAVFRTMNNELLEVIYCDGETEVRVRKQKGEGKDISGDYNQYDTCTEESYGEATVITYRNSGGNAVKQRISAQGYSWSLTAPEGYWGDSCQDFVNAVLGK